MKIVNYILKGKIGKLSREIDKKKDKKFFLRFLAKIKEKVGIYLVKRRGNSRILIKKYNSIYYPILKAAHSSILSAFKKISQLEEIKDIKKDNNYYKFTFVRNPFDRVVSLYEEKIFNPKSEKEIIPLLEYHGIYLNMSFKEFVKKISSISEDISDLHFRSQYINLFNENGTSRVNFIGKVEKLEEDYEKICRILEIKNSPELNRKNKSKREENYRDYYDDETKKLVAERYKKDLELLRYKF